MPPVAPPPSTCTEGVPAGAPVLEPSALGVTVVGVVVVGVVVVGVVADAAVVAVEVVVEVV
jgi:hypothetical protein